MRVAGIRYINALPLLYGLENQPGIELVLDSPSGCSRRLLAGEVDVALIPIIATQQNESVRAVKGLGIAAQNRTDSVFVFSKKPLDQVRSVLMDASSLSSAMLLKIILKERYGNVPSYETSGNIELYEALRNHDAILLIGDAALLAETTDFDHYDLATEWNSLTGLSFIFAVWASTRTLKDSEVQQLQSSYLAATQNWESIYQRAMHLMPVDLAFVRRYYNENLHYQLVRRDYEGLLKFLSFASGQQWIPGVRKDIWL